MIGVPITSNSVHISLVQTGCCKAEFDSTYPVHLNGIINQDEYRESINRINRKISSNKFVIILGIIFAVSMIVGMILFIVGGITAVNSRTYVFQALIGSGIGVTVFGSLLFSVGVCVVQYRRATQIRQAIVQESMKYSSRSPIPCSWRLETMGNGIIGYGNHHNSQLLNRIVIDIGRSTVSGNEIYYRNQDTNESRVFFGQQDQFAPPPYSGQTAVFCSQCGVTRHDLTAKFCSSCGQAFDKY